MDRGSEGDVVVVIEDGVDGVDAVGEEATGDGETGEDGDEVDIDVDVLDCMEIVIQDIAVHALKL